MRRLKWALVGTALLAIALPASAQEPSAEHLAAARQAIKALGATQQFDVILPNAADQLKQSLIQTAPNLQDIITASVDETALSLAGRRAALEQEAASIYARNFTIEELQAIAQFYDGPYGKKLLTTGPVASRELVRAAEVWTNGITRDLTVQTETALREQLGEASANDAAAGGDAPAEGSEGN